MQDASVILMPREACLRPRRAWWWLLVVLLLAVGGGWYWWNLPHAMRRVGGYQAYGDILNPTTTGCFTLIAPWQVAVHRWDGSLLWQVAVPSVTGSELEEATPSDAAFCVSPDGHNFAAARVVKRTVEVVRWHDGIVTDRWAVPLMVPMQDRGLRLLTRDDNSVYLMQSGPGSNMRTWLWKLRDGQVVAQGGCHRKAWLTPDGGTLLRDTATGYALSAVTLHEKTMSFSQETAITDGLNLDNYCYDGCYNYGALFDGGRVLSEQCRLFRAGQPPVTIAAGWGRDRTVSPASQYTFLIKGQRGRVYSPVTGDAWDLPLYGEFSGIDITDDGRYAMLTAARQVPSFIQDLLSPFNWQLSHTNLDIYDRTGRLRARRHINLDDAFSWWISPDGHYQVTMDTSAYCTVRRWD